MSVYKVVSTMSKTIMISKDAYERLKALKRGGESFSKLILRLLSHRKISLLDFAGKWPYSIEATREMERKLKETWKRGWAT